LAIKAFARALRAIPTVLADNAGYDSNELVAQLETAHAKGLVNAGLDMEKGVVGDMSQLKITESLKSKMQVLVSAHEAAEMILRVDEIIHAAPRYSPTSSPSPLLLHHLLSRLSSLPLRLCRVENVLSARTKHASSCRFALLSSLDPRPLLFWADWTVIRPNRVPPFP
jgi:hypothetical protein